jgi:hypothetical protein
MLPSVVCGKAFTASFGAGETALRHRSESGSGGVPLPDALGRKDPNAAKDCAWYWVFPASKSYLDPRPGAKWRDHFHESDL